MASNGTVSVSDCIRSILASFSSGLDVFRQFCALQDGSDKKPSLFRRPKKAREKSEPREDNRHRLARSLQQGSEEIGREYQTHAQAVGQRYASGDAIAHASLAEIQLRLNTGLVRIIHRFLARDQKPLKNATASSGLDFDELLRLSENSRVDTCHALRELYRRIVHSRTVHPSWALTAGNNRSRADAANGNAAGVSTLSAKMTKAGSKQTGTKSPKIPAGEKSGHGQRKKRIRHPTLARVYITDSSRPSQIAIVKPGERQKKVKGKDKPKSNRGSDVSSKEKKLATAKSMPQLHTARSAAMVDERTLPLRPANGGPRGMKDPVLPPLPASATTTTARPSIRHKHSLPGMHASRPANQEQQHLQRIPEPRAPLSHPTPIAAQSSPHLLAWLQTSSPSSAHGNFPSTTNLPITPPPRTTTTMMIPPETPPPPYSSPVAARHHHHHQASASASQPLTAPQRAEHRQTSPNNQSCAQDHSAQDRLAQNHLARDRFAQNHRYSTALTTRTYSTRLGEIPLHRWPEQDRWDFDRAEEGNARAVAEGWPVGRVEGEGRTRGEVGRKGDGWMARVRGRMGGRR